MSSILIGGITCEDVCFCFFPFWKIHLQTVVLAVLPPPRDSVVEADDPVPKHWLVP
jgi:hypothetical protein